MNIMLLDSLSAPTVSLIKQKEESSDKTSQQVIPTLIFTETEAGPHYISISNIENEETSVTNTYTTEKTTDQSVFLVRILKSNVLDIDADILIVALFLLCVILLIILLCCCLMHLACIRQCFNCSNQTIPETNLRNITKIFDTGEITKVSIWTSDKPESKFHVPTKVPQSNPAWTDQIWIWVLAPIVLSSSGSTPGQLVVKFTKNS